MPVYEYECKACSKIHELQQKIADAPLSTCPDCGGPVTKLMSMSSFQLKGGGWYADGYASKGAGQKEQKSAASCQAGGECKGCPASTASA